MYRLHQKQRGTKRKKVFIIGTALVAVCSAVLLTTEYAQDGHVTAITPIANTSATTPDERPVNVEASYEVPAENPRRIILPSLQKAGFIQQVGTDGNGSMGVPNNINIAGWFNQSPRPGDDGLSIIGGHVSGTQSPGIFKNLKNVKVNDSFSIEMGDLRLRNFVVKEVVTVSTEDAARILYDQRYTRQLNLITCSGEYIAEQRAYTQRTIIIAESL